MSQGPIGRKPSLLEFVFSKDNPSTRRFYDGEESLPRSAAMDIFLRLATAGLIPLAMGIFTAPSPDSSVLMEEMTFTEVRDAIRRDKTTVLIFNGSTEASGQHLALCKHGYRARYLGERIARELGNAFVAAVMPCAPLTDDMRLPVTINLSRGPVPQGNE